MGARGPAAKPVELRVLDGNRGRRPIDTGEFRPQADVPDAPRYLSPDARKAWRRHSPELHHYSLLAKIDREAFALLCQTIGRVEMIERSLAARQALKVAEGKDPADALIDRTPNGLPIQSALYQILNREQAKLHQMLATFGMRPDARTRVTPGTRAQLKLFDGGQGAPAGFAGFD